MRSILLLVEKIVGVCPNTRKPPKHKLAANANMQLLTNPQIDELEESLDIVLPGLYRKLLVEIGVGELPSGRQIYDPTEIAPLYEPFFDDPGDLFDPYFPFGCHNRLQEVWIIDSSRELAASISHETVPDDWPEEEWLSYEEWIFKHLDPEFEQSS
jgi:hypothetical protein